MMGVLSIFGEGNFIFSFVGYGLVTKSLGVGCTIEEVEEKKKMSKDECESYNQIKKNHLT
jgi:hypothetical protein